jgi:hypothetical protein
MTRNTRSQTAANVRSANLTSATGIHRLPNEILAHIFVTGCPTSNHKLYRIDMTPLQHQVLVGSVCKLWRNIAHGCAALWISVAIRYPMPKGKSSGSKLKFYEMIFSVLPRSGTMEVDLSIKTESVPVFWKSTYSHRPTSPASPYDRCGIPGPIFGISPMLEYARTPGASTLLH